MDKRPANKRSNVGMLMIQPAIESHHGEPLTELVSAIEEGHQNTEGDTK